MEKSGSFQASAVLFVTIHLFTILPSSCRFPNGHFHATVSGCPLQTPKRTLILLLKLKLIASSLANRNLWFILIAKSICV
jgi:hypothetical protein